MTESSGMKTGSPEKDITDLTAFHVNGGALDNDEDNVNATDDLEDMVSDNDDFLAMQVSQNRMRERGFR